MRLVLVRLRVAQGGILIDAGYSVLAQRPKVPRARLVSLVPYYALALALPKRRQKDAYSRRTDYKNHQ